MNNKQINKLGLRQSGSMSHILFNLALKKVISETNICTSWKSVTTRVLSGIFGICGRFGSSTWIRWYFKNTIQPTRGNQEESGLEIKEGTTEYSMVKGRIDTRCGIFKWRYSLERVQLTGRNGKLVEWPDGPSVPLYTRKIY